jgi:archaeosortase B (VPXXXP-CTERM-specific)
LSKKNPKVISQKPRPEGRGFSAKSSKAGQKKIATVWAQYHRVLIPVIEFLVIVGVFIALYYIFLTSSAFHAFMVLTARVTGFLLNLFGSGVKVQDTIVSSSQFAFQIVDLCTAIMPMLIFTAAVIAYPSKIKEKLFGLLIGLAGIFIVNQIRLVSLFYIGIYAPGIFETAHLLVWQSLMILLAIGLWLIWAYKYVRSSVI